MKLTDLHPRWVGAGGEGIHRVDGSQAPARHGVGITFDCPCGCADRVYVAFSNPVDGGDGYYAGSPDHAWQREGDTFETLTIRPSIQRVGGCAWHGFVTAGEVTQA